MSRRHRDTTGTHTGRRDYTQTAKSESGRKKKGETEKNEENEKMMSISADRRRRQSPTSPHYLKKASGCWPKASILFFLLLNKGTIAYSHRLELTYPFNDHLELTD